LETTTKAKERIESELRIARNIQQSMLPSLFPNREGVDLYGLMLPAKEVGGDLYDYLLTEDRLYVCLGDVSGKGVPAALFMAQAIRMFRALAKQGLMPAEIAKGLNDELVLGNENGMFVTMFIGLINLNTGHMDFCNAGHNPPVLNGEFLKMESNAPIGLWESFKYVGEQVENIKDIPLFIYSDGLNEAENLQQKQFGEENLLRIIRKGGMNNARLVIETMSQEVEKHRNGADPNDDLTMLCLKIS
jgi:serine phosphatase RsbU (regulator of sigma subunit)